jgi:hypothetical protein
MTDSNCSRHRDCVYLEAISDVSGAILCVPNSLKILPLNAQTSTEGPVLG